MALIAACAVAAFIAIRRRRDWSSLVAPLLAPVGFVAFQLFLAAHTGESWAWFRVQREAWREGTSFGATAVSNTVSFLTHPLASPTDALTAASLACPRTRAVVPVAQAPALADGRLRRRGHRADAAAGDGHRPAPLPVHGVPALHQRRRHGGRARDRAIWDLVLVGCGAGLTGLDRPVRRVRCDPVTAAAPCLSVVVPCFNEAATIAELSTAVLDSPWTAEIVVVDDGSTDGTARCSTGIDDPRVRVIRHERNRGKGAALRTGFAAPTAEYVIVQDADLEYDPAEYGAILEPLEAGQADVVFGSRFLSGRPHRVLYFWHSLGNRR